MTDSIRQITRALISVSDKSGLVPFAKALIELGVEIVSTGGTAAALTVAGLPVRDVSELTGFPEMMDGRVKTLHPAVHGGLLAIRDNAEHQRAAREHSIAPIDLLVVSLYPFEATLEAGADFDTCIENIDIGGPAMIRAAAKNFDGVAVIVDPDDYEPFLAEMRANSGGTRRDLRRKLAAKAFSRTAAYDAAISAWFADVVGDEAPTWRSFSGRLAQQLRYGENPHQSAALYRIDEVERPGAASAKQIQGKELSYNNLNDTNAAFELVAEFEEPTVAIIKHANPCGVASAKTIPDAYEKALSCDPVSAFGGIIALNRRLDRETAEAITQRFVEVIIAPDVEAAALDILAAKKNIRVLTTGEMPDPLAPRRTMTRIAGGMLVQDMDIGRVTEQDLKVVTDREPTPDELKNLLFAFRVGKHVKSNAIVYAKGLATVGIGAGQMSRLDSSRIAARKAQDAAEAMGLAEPLTKGSVVASDAFFPFADGLIAAAEAGVTAVIQPGGSIRDDEVIEAANERGLAMVFTGMRHFRH